jgi:hypothetical protein
MGEESKRFFPHFHLLPQLKNSGAPAFQSRPEVARKSSNPAGIVLFCHF